MNVAMCPSCGYDFEADAPIVRPEIVSDPRGQVLFHGCALSLTPAERVTLHALLRADGGYIDQEAIRNRLGSPEMSNIPEVMVCRLRVKLAQVDASREWIVTQRGVGYRWAGDGGAAS